MRGCIQNDMMQIASKPGGLSLHDVGTSYMWKEHVWLCPHTHIYIIVPRDQYTPMYKGPIHDGLMISL